MIESDRGFYFAVFQSDSSRDRVKAWIDGSEDYSLFSHEEFVALAFDIEPTMRRALQDYSYFLWDVQKKTINRLRFQQEPEALRKLLVEHKLVEDTSEPETIADRYFKHDSKVDADRVSIKTE